MTPHAALEIAREYFDEWYPSGAQFLHHYRSAVTEGWLNNAAFQLHQATERYYHCILLVCTFHTPHIHNLVFLRTQAERIDDRLIEAWPREVKADRSEEHTSELQSLMRISYAVFCLKKKNKIHQTE